MGGGISLNGALDVIVQCSEGNANATARDGMSSIHHFAAKA